MCDLFLQDIHTPAMFLVAHTFTLRLSSALIRAYLKKSNCPRKPLVLWGVQMIHQLSILLTHPLPHTKNAFLLSNDRLASRRLHEHSPQILVWYGHHTILPAPISQQSQGSEG